MLPQNEKLNGVVNTQSAVLMAVSETDNSELPLQSEVMKLEMFPPGHAATRIIPSETIGVRILLNVMQRTNVNAGRRISWQIIPMITDLGFLRMSINVFGLIPSATPNITIARTMFNASIPPPPPM